MTKIRAKIKALRGLDLTELYFVVQARACEYYKIHDENISPYGDEQYRELINATKSLPERLAMIAYLYATTADIQSVLWDDWEFVRKAVKPGRQSNPTAERLADEEFNRFAMNFKTLTKAHLRKRGCVLKGIAEHVYLCGDYEKFEAMYPVDPKHPHVIDTMVIHGTERLLYSSL